MKISKLYPLKKQDCFEVEYNKYQIPTYESLYVSIVIYAFVKQ